MSRSWRARAAIACGCWALVVVGLALLHMRPNAVLLATMAAAAATLLWLMVDLSDVAAPADWNAPSEAGGSNRGADERVRLLQRQLSDGPARDGGTVLYRTLVELADDRLLAGHGIDRATDPDRAAAMAGPELESLLTAMPSDNRLANPAFVSMILSRIEAL